MIRYDASAIGEIKRTPQGGIRVDARLTKTGIFEYKNPDGSTRREYRPPDEVFKANQLDAMKGMPVVIGHRGLVTADEWPRQAVGHVGDDVRQDGKHIAASLVIQHPKAVKAVTQKELRELSVGYEVDYDETPGEADGQRFDGTQRNMRPNHVALLPKGKGRAGEDCSLRLDGKGDEVINYTWDEMDPKELADLLAKARAEGVSQARMDAKADSDKLQAQVDTLTAKVETLTKDAAASVARFDAAVSEHVELIETAKSFKVDGKGKSARQIKEAVIAAKNPSMRLDGKSTEYVDAAYTMAISEPLAVKPHQTLGGLRQDASNAIGEAAKGSGDKIAQARQKNSQASLNAWKTGN